MLTEKLLIRAVEYSFSHHFLKREPEFCDKVDKKRGMLPFELFQDIQRIAMLIPHRHVPPNHHHSRYSSYGDHHDNYPGARNTPQSNFKIFGDIVNYSKFLDVDLTKKKFVLFCFVLYFGTHEVILGCRLLNIIGCLELRDYCFSCFLTPAFQKRISSQVFLQLQNVRN